MTLTEFLLARIAEDEAQAKADQADAMAGSRWKHLTTKDYYRAQSEALAGTKRAARECEAKRRIVDNATNMHTSGPDWDEAVRLLAAVYADHPDYRDEWRP